jgi:hypothetical protein
MQKSSLKSYNNNNNNSNNINNEGLSSYASHSSGLGTMQTNNNNQNDNSNSQNSNIYDRNFYKSDENVTSGGEGAAGQFLAYVPTVSLANSPNQNNNNYTNKYSSNTFEQVHNEYENNGAKIYAHNEKLAREVLDKAGPKDLYQRQDHYLDITDAGESYKSRQQKSSSSIFNPGFINNKNKSEGGDNCAKFIKIEELGEDYDEENTENDDSGFNLTNSINQDSDPIHIVKPSSENIVYKQEVSIRYLQPPTPQPPAPIIIR